MELLEFANAISHILCDLNKELKFSFRFRLKYLVYNKFHKQRLLLHRSEVHINIYYYLKPVWSTRIRIQDYNYPLSVDYTYECPISYNFTAKLGSLFRDKDQSISQISSDNHFKWLLSHVKRTYRYLESNSKINKSDPAPSKNRFLNSWPNFTVTRIESPTYRDPHLSRERTVNP